MTQKFIDKVRNAYFIDTRKYRYRARLSNCLDNTVLIERIPLDWLGTDKAYDKRSWITVAFVKGECA